VTVSNFWEDGDFFVPAGALDAHLSGNSTVQAFARPREMVLQSGSRVAFTYTLSALLSYPEPPNRGVPGTVVMVRTAAGDTTELDGMVFVKWDDGRFMGVHKAHLVSAPGTTRTANAYRMVVSAMGDLTDFLKVAGGDDELIHKSSKDLWKLSKSKGTYVIERLFDETGNPLKV
jgi:hypothetical protein